MDNENNNVESLIDHHRWLLNSGVVHDSIKNQLFMFGSIVNKSVAAVDLTINVETKTVFYKIFINKDLISKVDKFEILRESKTLIGLWRFKRFLKKEGNLDFNSILNSFIKDYCGSAWIANVTTINFDDYIEDYEGENSSSIEINSISNE